MADIKFNRAPDFLPHYSPLEMLSMGVFGGTIFNKVSQRVGLPPAVLSSQSDRWNRHQYSSAANYFNIEAPMQYKTVASFEIPSTIIEANFNKWFHWYSQFYYSMERPTTNNFRIAEWKSVITILHYKLKIECGLMGIPITDTENHNDAVKTIRQLMLQYAWDSTKVPNF